MRPKRARCCNSRAWAGAGAQGDIWQIPSVRYAMAAAMFLALGIGSWGVLRSILSWDAFHGSQATVQISDGQLFRCRARDWCR